MKRALLVVAIPLMLGGCEQAASFFGYGPTDSDVTFNLQDANYLICTTYSAAADQTVAFVPRMNEGQKAKTAQASDTANAICQGGVLDKKLLESAFGAVKVLVQVQEEVGK